MIIQWCNNPTKPEYIRGVFERRELDVSKVTTTNRYFIFESLNGKVSGAKTDRATTERISDEKGTKKLNKISLRKRK